MTKTKPIIRVERRENATIATVLVHNILADAEVQRFRDALGTAAYDQPGAPLILDFTNVRAISSSAIGLLVALQKQMDREDTPLRICCIDKKVANTPGDRFVFEIFKVVKLDTFFTICNDVPAALASLPKDPPQETPPQPSLPPDPA